MRILWLTKLLPYPSLGGDLIYSRQLIEGCAKQGAELTIVCHAGVSRDQPAKMPGLTWHVVKTAPRSRLLALFSTLPNIAARYDGLERRKITMELLNQGNWDGIVFDGPGPLALLDAVNTARQALALRPFVAYVSHNHEETIRYATAQVSPTPWEKAAQYLDAIKTGWLERKATRLSDVLTVNTEEDGRLFRQHISDRQYEVIAPGYGGLRSPPQSLAPKLRRAIVLGSFQWAAKRANVEAFLNAANAIFPKSGITFDVVGFMDEDYRGDLQQKFPWANIVGTVSSTTESLRQARIGVVPEIAGGGFKHKILDYAFSHLPIAAMTNAMAGVPLEPGTDFIAASNFEDLASTIVAHIDNAEELENMARRAFKKCEKMFDWQESCVKLLTVFTNARTEIQR